MVDYCRMGTEFQFRKILEKAWVGRPVLSSVDTNPLVPMHTRVCTLVCITKRKTHF